MNINSNIIKKIVALLQWDDGRYERYVHECGIAYLYAYIKDEADEVIDEIKRSKCFWDWWKDHWQKRDEVFLESVTPRTKAHIARQLYQQMHCPAMLASELYLDGQVLGESYAHMIQQLNKETVCN